MNSSTLSLSAALLASLLAWAAFITLYFWYGNLLRAAAGRALMIMSLGYALVLVPTVLRHPFGITTANVAFAWFQAVAAAGGLCGTAALIWLMVRANGKPPWRR